MDDIDEMKRGENPQAIGSEREERGEKEKNLKQENTELHEYEEEDNEYISLSPWSEEDIEIEKMKKEISEFEEITRDNKKLPKWKGEDIEDFKDSIIRKRDELPKY